MGEDSHIGEGCPDFAFDLFYKYMPFLYAPITGHKHMEEDLKRNLGELERFNKLAIGRELKMIQLKQEINELLIQLGQAEKYEIVE